MDFCLPITYEEKSQDRAKKWIVFYLLKWREKIFFKTGPPKVPFSFLFKWEVKNPVDEAGKISRQGYRHQPFENNFRLWLIFVQLSGVESVQLWLIWIKYRKNKKARGKKEKERMEKWSCCYFIYSVIFRLLFGVLFGWI